VRRDLQNELNQKIKRSIRNQLVGALLGKVTIDLPESVVQKETRNVVYDLVNENQRRGVAREVIDREKDQIYAAATQTANDRVKVGFLFHKIAEKEGIRATKEELNARIVSMASAYQMPVDKFVKELEKRDGFSEVYQQIIHEKVLDFLHESAKLEDVAPGQAPE
jgi:trigger factor